MGSDEEIGKWYTAIGEESMEKLGITPPLPVPRPAYQGTSA
jgi:hypothetical protein